MEFGPEDLLEFGLHYLPSLVWSVVTCSVTFIAGVLVVRRRPDRRRVGNVMVCSAALPLVCWVVYFASPSELTYTLGSLGCESSQFAERTYLPRFTAPVPTLYQSVHFS